MTQNISAPNECTLISAKSFRDQLSSAGNLFYDTDALSFDRQLCLPPDTRLELTSKELIIRNRLTEIRFTVLPSGSISFMPPGLSPEDQLDPTKTQLPDGQPRYETRQVGVRIEVFYSNVRAQSPNLPKYQEWAKRVIEGAAQWFEPPKDPVERLNRT
jgi:hypothetical protein